MVGVDEVAIGPVEQVVDVLLHHLLPEHVAGADHVVGEGVVHLNGERLGEFERPFPVFGHHFAAVSENRLDDFLMRLSQAVGSDI